METNDEIEGRLFRAVVIGQCTYILRLKLFAGENEASLIRWNTLFVLDLGLHVIDSVVLRVFTKI